MSVTLFTGLIMGRQFLHPRIKVNRPAKFAPAPSARYCWGRDDSERRIEDDCH
jgi:hypothetical protein